VDILLLALSAALNPTLLAATTVMLLLPKPRNLMLGYLLGAMMTSVSLGLVIVFSLEDSGAVEATKDTLGPAADLALGAIFLIVAGDTDLFEGMAALAEKLDLALLPVWGWGPNLGPGHLDPKRAARAVAMLSPRIAVPIHWGTFFPLGLASLLPRRLSAPPHEFAGWCERLAPQVVVRILLPGEARPHELGRGSAGTQTGLRRSV
jgi:hypothetical protein